MSPKRHRFEEHPGWSAIFFAALSVVFLEGFRIGFQWPTDPWDRFLSKETGYAFIASLIVGLIGYVFLLLRDLKRGFGRAESDIGEQLEHVASRIDGLVGPLGEIRQCMNEVREHAELTAHVTRTSLKLQEPIGRLLEDFRNDALVTTAPLSQQSEPFHDAFSQIMAEKKASVRWLAAKFVARKLANDFASFRDGSRELAYIDKKGIDELLGVLIPESKDRVLFTFPYTPEEWVTGVPDFKKHCKDCPHVGEHETCPIVPGLLGKTIDLPNHLGLLGRSTARIKRRFVVPANSSDWSESCHLHVLALCSELARVETLFFDQETPAVGAPSKNIIDVNQLDDVLITAKFRRPSGSQAPQRAACSLVLDPDKVQAPFERFKGEKALDPSAWTQACDWAKGRIDPTKTGA